ncbi:MAG: hypothetical protein R3C70_07020 [Geminicoccaceae bacterium]
MKLLGLLILVVALYGFGLSVSRAIFDGNTVPVSFWISGFLGAICLATYQEKQKKRRNTD